MNESYLLFEKYLTNNISKEDRVFFERKLKNDLSFKEEFNTYKDASSFLENKFKNEEKLNQFKENLQKISNKNFTPTKKKIFKIWRYGAVASILLLAGIFFFNSNEKPSYDNFVNYNTIELTVRNSQNNTLFKAEKAYNSKDFTTAITFFNSLLKENPNNSEIQLYKGFSLIEINKFNKAQKILNPIANGNSAFKHKAIWYLALSNLKQKNYKACLNHLHLIPETAEEYTMAKKLINKLE